jgi:hypothetical protein
MQTAEQSRSGALDSAETLIALPDFMRRQALQYFLLSLSVDERAVISRLAKSLPPRAGQALHDLISHIEAWR